MVYRQFPTGWCTVTCLHVGYTLVSDSSSSDTLEQSGIGATMSVSFVGLRRNRVNSGDRYGQIRAQLVRASRIFVLGEPQRQTKSDAKTGKSAVLPNVHGGFRCCPRAESAVHHATVLVQYGTFRTPIFAPFRSMRGRTAGCGMRPWFSWLTAVGKSTASI
jgi:hypothetical protein